MSTRRSIVHTLTAIALVSAGCLGMAGCVQRVQSQTPTIPPSGTSDTAQGDAQAPTEPPPPPTFATGTLVAGVDVGGAQQERAAHLVRYHLKPLAERKVTLHYGQRTFARTWDELGVKPDVDTMLQKAWSVPIVPLEVAVDMAKAKRSIRRAAIALDIQPVAPRLIGEPGKGTIKDGKTGRKVNVHASALLLQKTLADNQDAASALLVVVPDEPDFTAADLRTIRRPVVTYTTRFNPGERSRTHNLRLVAQRLNGALVRPGATFSFNDWVGERRPEDGYRDAIVYKEGKMVKDTAGGLCQVSSTLYNVALLAGLPIVERSNHSLTVAYVPLGRDATIYWGQQDLRFRNDTDTPLYIRTHAGRRTLTIEAWGAAPLKRDVKVTSHSSRRNGKAFAQVYRTVVENGKRTRERISSDAYSTVHTTTPKRPRT